MIEGEVVVRKNRPWFSIGVLIGVAVIAASGAGVYFEVRAGQSDVSKRLETNELAVTEGNKTLASMAEDVRAVRLDVNEALSDRWTATDTKFWGLEIERFWSDFQRLNATVTVPTWPSPKRVTTDDHGER